MISLCLFLLHFTRAWLAPPRLAAPVVDLGYSKYHGVRLSAGVDQYLGMRYALPPLNELRFRAPQDPQNTTSVQDASTFGAVCIGAGQRASETVGEDCLFINVFTPANATSHSRLPVWVHIQGGGYATNSNANFNGTKVIQRAGYDILFVNFNYRVGALGFLASEKVRREGDLNVGLLDQRKALLWVHQHIDQFGGDPEHVVLHGDSAGAGSVAHHMAAYGSRDGQLFVGAVYESTFWPTLRTVADMEFQFDRLVSDTGCSGSESQLTCLRATDIDRFQQGNTPTPFPGGSANPPPLWYFLPVIDGTFIEDQLYELFEQGRTVVVPLLVGDDTDEGSTFAANASNKSEVSSFFQANYPKLRPESLDAIHVAYPPASPVPLHAPYFTSASAAYGDAAFTCPGNFISSTIASHPSSVGVWNYRYDVQAPELVSQGLGVPHIFELSAVFGVGYAGNSETSSYKGINQDIVPTVMDYWISFVKFLDPNPGRRDQAPYWETWGVGVEKRLRIQTNMTAMETLPSSSSTRCLLWRRLSREMEV